MKKKPVPLYPPEFVAKDIKEGDWVYAPAFQLFAKVTFISPRVAQIGSHRIEYREEIEKCDKTLRGYQPYSPSVVLSTSPGASVRFDSSEYNRLCSNHLVKVTPDVISRFVGDKTLRITQALAVIKL